MKSTIIHSAKILFNILEMRFKPVVGHSMRVAKYALVLAR